MRLADYARSQQHLSHLSPAAVQHTLVNARAGDAGAMLWVGQRMLWGDGAVPVDEVAAAELFAKAAALGHPEANALLGSLYAEGRGGLPKNITTAVK